MNAAVRSLWPNDLKTDDVRTPAEILREQAELLERQTNGVLTGDLVEHLVEDRKVIGLDVNAPRIPTTIRLFDVYQSPKFDYPARINPPTYEVPEYLKKSVFLPGPLDTAHSPLEGLTGKWVEQRWVADSATEFTELLHKLLSSSEIKSILNNLLTRSKKPPAAATQTSPSDSVKSG